MVILKETEELAATVLQLCRERELYIAVAESCTGGMVGALLTAVPGSSDAFMGGIIAYDNDVKRELLGVRGEHLAMYGAVSEPVALEMEAGVRKILHAEVGVSVTGIAGPGGASPEKPVGTVWIACNGSAKQFFMAGDRAAIRQQATHAALGLARDAILGM